MQIVSVCLIPFLFFEIPFMKWDFQYMHMESKYIMVNCDVSSNIN